MIYTYIYVLIDPRTYDIRYVGKTNNIIDRYKNHTNPAKDKNTHKRNWINELRREGLKPIIQTIDKVLIDDWHDKEKFYITKFKEEGCSLVNHTEGGDGLSFGNQTSFKKGNKSWNEGLGRKFICEWCHKEYRPLNERQIFCSSECYAAYQKGNQPNGGFLKGFKPWNKDKSGYNTSKQKKVFQYSALTGVFVREWGSANEAAFILHGNGDSISNCCRGVSQTASGYTWRYELCTVTPVIYTGKVSNLIINNLK